MKRTSTHYSLTTADTIEALNVLIRYVEEQVYYGEADEAVVGKIRNVIDALESADTIEFIP